MAFGGKSAADIQAIIDAALGKKPVLPKGLEEEIRAKEAAVAARKAAKAKAAADASAADETQAKSVEKTLGKAVTAKKVSKKALNRKAKEENEAKKKKATMKAVKKGTVAITKKKKSDRLERLKLKATRKARKSAKKSLNAAAAEEEKKAAQQGGSDDSDNDDADFDSEEDESLFGDENDSELDEEFFMDDNAKQEKALQKALNRAITGGADKDALAEDPLAATFGGAFGFGVANMRDAVESMDPETAIDAALAANNKGSSSSSLLHDLAQKKGAEYVPQEALLNDAHKFFAVLSENEKKVNMLARKKIAEMKAINKRGGDKDGFKYVLPTSVKSYARQLSGDGVDIPENLQSHFLGDGVQDTDKAPSRKKEKKKYHDDFYSFQIAKKWTKNAENFLSKATRTKNMFINRQQKLRTTKKM